MPLQGVVDFESLGLTMLDGGVERRGWAVCCSVEAEPYLVFRSRERPRDGCIISLGRRVLRVTAGTWHL